MILNAYAILDGFLVLFRFPLALAVMGLSLYAWRRSHMVAGRRASEDRFYLLVLLAGLLVGLNLVAWPLFYALLQSYVPQWPGVMCVYGVTRIGLGSEGASRFLPGLLTTLQIAKPLVIFASGAWFVVYLANRGTRESSLMPHTLGLLMLFAMVSLADASVAAYLLIPKSEKFLAVGCCAAAVTDLERAARFVPTAMLGEDSQTWLRWAYFGINAAVPLGLVACRFRMRGVGFLPTLLVAVLAIPVSFVFLVEVAAPAILGLPYHHCPYDLLAVAPETALGIAAFLIGVCAIGWACLVDRIGRSRVDGEEVRRVTERLLFVAAVALLASLTLFGMELVLA